MVVTHFTYGFLCLNALSLDVSVGRIVIEVGLLFGGFVHGGRSAIDCLALGWLF